MSIISMKSTYLKVQSATSFYYNPNSKREARVANRAKKTKLKWKQLSKLS